MHKNLHLCLIISLFHSFSFFLFSHLYRHFPSFFYTSIIIFLSLSSFASLSSIFLSFINLPASFFSFFLLHNYIIICLFICFFLGFILSFFLSFTPLLSFQFSFFHTCILFTSLIILLSIFLSLLVHLFHSCKIFLSFLLSFIPVKSLFLSSFFHS